MKWPHGVLGLMALFLLGCKFDLDLVPAPKSDGVRPDISRPDMPCADQATIDQGAIDLAGIDQGTKDLPGVDQSQGKKVILRQGGFGSTGRTTSSKYRLVYGGFSGAQPLCNKSKNICVKGGFGS